MSVINEMLQSMDERNKDIELAMDKKGYLLKPDNTNEQAVNQYRPYILVSLMILSVGYFLWAQLPEAPVEAVIQEAPKPMTLDKVLVDKDVSTPEAIADKTTDDNKAAPEPILQFIDHNLKQVIPAKKQVVIYEIVPEKPAKSIDVNTLLIKAKEALRRDRLTSPTGANAFYFYQQILDVYPDNAQALKGINAIVNRYIYFANKVIKKGEEYKLPELIRNAYLVGEHYMDMEPLLARFSKYIANDVQTFDGYNDSEAPNEPKSPAQDDMQIAPAIEHVDRETARIATKLVADGDLIGAKMVLENFTRLSDYWAESYDALLQIYLDEGAANKAESLIYDNKTLSAYQLAEKAARVFVARNDAAGALAMLQGHTPPMQSHEKYYSLQAALLHKAGDFSQAVDIYRSLLKVDHTNARYWLGLAVSLDSLRDKAGALKAFEYANQYAKPESTVKAYIAERIASLSS